MALSSEYVRLATSSARALADTALDSLRDAVLVIDAHHQHLPVVLANAAARGRLWVESSAAGLAAGLIESPLHRWLTPASCSVIESALSAVSESKSVPDLALTWRFADGERAVSTQIKALASAPGQRLVMMTLGTGARLRRTVGGGWGRAAGIRRVVRSAGY